MKLNSALFTFSLTSYALAQGLDALAGTSDGCLNASAQLLQSPISVCANLLQLVSLASSQGSVVTSLQTYVKGVCPKEPCTASDVSTARSSIQSACAPDIARNDPIALALNAVLGDYPNTRSLLCSQEIAAGGTFCLPTTLRSIATAAGINATLANITSIISNNNAEGFMQLVNSVPTAAYCTDCSHAIVTLADRIVTNAAPSQRGAAAQAAASQCGANFADDLIPSTIETTGDVGSPPTGDCVRLSSFSAWMLAVGAGLAALT